MERWVVLPRDRGNCDTSPGGLVVMLVVLCCILTVLAIAFLGPVIQAPQLTLH